VLRRAQGRTWGAAALLTLCFSLLSPVGALACSGGTTTGIASGGSQPGPFSPFGPIGGDPTAFVILSSFVVLSGAAVLAIALAKTLRRPQPAPTAQFSADSLSPDGLFWWNGVVWRPTGRRLTV
jgi:hypothetical protein